MRNVIIDAMIAMTLLVLCAPMFAWLSQLADDPATRHGSTMLELVFMLLMFLSLIGGAILAFSTFWEWHDSRNES